MLDPFAVATVGLVCLFAIIAVYGNSWVKKWKSRRR